MTAKIPPLRRRAALAIPAALALPSLARAAPGLTLSLATATPGGGFPAYGEALAAGVGGADTALRLAPRNTAGSAENARLLAEGAVDLGLVAGEVATGALAEGKGLSVIAAIYATPGVFAVPAASPAGGLRDLVGRPVAWGARGSGFVVLARRVLGTLGLDIERDFEAVYLDRAGDAPGLVESGRVAALWGGGAGWPAFTALASAAPGVRFLAPDTADRLRAVTADPILREMVLQPGSYPNQSLPVVSVGTWSYVLARPGLPEEEAYRLAAAIDAGRPALAERLPQGRETTPENTRRSVPDPGMIHPGARRLLRERGIE